MANEQPTPLTDPTAGVASMLRATISATAVQRALLSTVGGTVLIVWPNRGLSIAATIAGIVLIAVGASELADGGFQRDRWHIAIGIGAIVGGAVLIFLRHESDEVLALLVGIGIGSRALADGVTVFRSGTAGFQWIRLIRSLGLLLFAGFVSFGSEDTVVAAILAIGVSWVSVGLITLASIQSDPDGPTAAAERPTPVLIRDWFDRRSNSFDYRDAVFDKLLFDGSQYRARYTQFTVLMVFSTAIATLGVQSDSTAVVIGAMLVAPLMTPIMATSASLVMGWSTRAFGSVLIVVFGVIVAIVCSYLLSKYAPGFVSLENNTQVSSRTSPTMLDLLIALAAGGAGAYAVTRPDVSDSLPGVAIAVALVPPLAVVGITLAADDPDSAGGAMLLFLTNFVGIVLASGIVFVVSGLVPIQLLRENQDQLQRTLWTVVGALVLVSIPLALTGQDILNDATRESNTSEIVEAWMEPAEGLRLVELNVEDSEVEIVVSGNDTLPDVDRLAASLAVDVLDDPQVTVRQIPELVTTSGTE